MVKKNNDDTTSGRETEEDLNLSDVGITMSKRSIDIDPRSYPMIVLAIVFLGVCVILFSNIAKMLTALVIAILFALALDPVICKVQNFREWKIFNRLNKNTKKKQVKQLGRYISVTLVLGMFAVVVGIGLYLVAPKVGTQVKNFAKDIPETVKGLEKIPLVGKKIGSKENQEKISEALKELPKKLSSKDSPLGDIFQSIANGAYLGFLFIMMFITLLLDGPRVVRNVRSLIPDRNKEAADRIANALHRVIGKYMAGSIFVALLAGLVMGAAGLIMGLSLVPLLVVWITFTNLIPQIGGLLGAVPFILFGFGESPIKGTICALIFLAYQQVENHVIQPIVIGKTIKISPPITMVAALLGASAGGIIGAMLAVPFVGVVKAMAAEFDFPRGVREKMIEKEIIKPTKSDLVKTYST